VWRNLGAKMFSGADELWPRKCRVMNRHEEEKEGEEPRERERESDSLEERTSASP
jgi:hypothetical protein